MTPRTLYTLNSATPPTHDAHHIQALRTASAPREQEGILVEELSFLCMNKAELRQWVEANPGRVNDRDSYGETPLVEAARKEEGLALVVWLLDEKGADVNATTVHGRSALYYAGKLDILTALMDRGADPTLADGNAWLPLMWHTHYGSVAMVARLLQDPRVRAAVNMQDEQGHTALHRACYHKEIKTSAHQANLLLQGGANPNITNSNGLAPLAWIRQYRPNRHAVIALLEQYPVAQEDAEKASSPPSAGTPRRRPICKHG